MLAEGTGLGGIDNHDTAYINREDCEDPANVRRLFNLYKVATTPQDRDLKNHIVDKLVEMRDPGILVIRGLSKEVKSTCDFPRRLADLQVRRVGEIWRSEHRGTLPSTFLAVVAQRVKTRAESGELQSKSKRHPTCDYHEHEDDEEICT